MNQMRIILLCFIIGVSKAAEEWTYTDTSKWPSLNITNNMCDGEFQTPVALTYSDAMYNAKLPPISFTVDYVKTERPLYNMILTNDGHKVVLSFPRSSMITRLIFGTDPKYYTRVIHIHFHWGSDNNKGSEHSLNGKYYPMEAHLVNYNEKVYGSNVASSVTGPTGLAVFGLFFELVHESQKLDVMDTITNAMNASFQAAVPSGGSYSIEIQNVPLLTLFHNRLRDYYRYIGSLTTPPCTENVLWTVSRTPVPITQTQLNRFRDIKFSGSNNQPMVNNFRIIQLLNPERPDLATRVITRSFSAACLLRVPLSSLILALIVSILMFPKTL